ncbi:MAG: M20/M25/M40 family metallo-hydrolase [Myxococcales bacterium]|nr:M20/M25/M40 family metallo-hydrolase [Myxococcales bacterium]
MRAESLAFFKKLLTEPSPSGYEAKAQAIWLNYARQFAEGWYTDAYGNAFACINKGGSPRVMLTGHADEIGFIVGHIDDKGFVYLRAVGGIDTTSLRGKRLTIHSESGPVRGVFGATAIHLRDRDKANNAPKMHELFVDIGAVDKAAAEELVSIGDAATLVDDFELLNEHIGVARAFDNRVGTFSAVEALRLLSEVDGLDAEVWAVATVQEEIGGDGAEMAAYSLKPDVCLAVDVTHATDTPGLSPSEHGDVKLGGGPTVSFGSVNHPVLVRRLKEAAAKADIPLQFEVTPRATWTDLDSISVQHGGIVGAVIGIPNRYMHTAVEMIDLRDLTRTAELMAALVRDLRTGDDLKVPVLLD